MTHREHALSSIGFDAHFQAALAERGAEFIPARIAIAFGESYVAWTAEGPLKAVLLGHRSPAWRTAELRPQVGDWVVGRKPEANGPLFIEQLLPRATSLVRRAAGDRAAAQIIAANVDVVGVVSALDSDTTGVRSRRQLNETRLQRYLAAVHQSGAKPVLIVNKCDLHADASEVAAMLAQIFPDVPIALTSGAEGSGIEQVERWLAKARTMVLVGMSGVGKSTLVNALLGRPTQPVQSVRPGDARGRHTTTHRELFLLAGGGLLIDTPGMRELGLWEADETAAFEDVAALASTCRFTDCQHQREPGCAIHAALQNGTLLAARFASYQAHVKKTLAPQRHQRGVTGAKARRR